MKDDTQEQTAKPQDKPKKATPKPVGKTFGRRGHEKRKGGAQ